MCQIWIPCSVVVNPVVNEFSEKSFLVSWMIGIDLIIAASDWQTFSARKISYLIFVFGNSDWRRGIREIVQIIKDTIVVV
ncbi:uncharacterized protein RAG0_04626 [Rhynchosporium agropyri]|uniref:Uncharacterized protein n=1 Tax=Rhynchosporium agropyri TaxID=914238 RepID=A0A1E1K9L4_9HELO|nr:uncharacterized protein RAG0_04626 [Rhynchosporium agropyri]